MENSVTAPAGTAQASSLLPLHPADRDLRWWRSSVIYQIYPRSFRDLSGDGVGDLAGITAGLGDLANLNIDAVWLSPFFTSPQKDGGYDVSDYCDVDPLFGSLDDFDLLVQRAHELDIKVIIDLVPNHCSSEHPFFQSALAAGPDSAEREMFVFRNGRGGDGGLPPNNWQSHFGGPAWTRVQEADGSAGQWYLHLFDSSQPDFNWDNEAVRAEFERILNFWLQRGVNGFRVDVAHALVKAKDLPDWGGRADGVSTDGFPGHEAPMFGQEELHNIYRRWREILDSYSDGTRNGDRILCAEASIDPLPRLAHWVRQDEMHQAFNFAYLGTGWDADALRSVISSSLSAFDEVGAPTTWVLSNHDVVRHTTRFGYSGNTPRDGDGVGPNDPQPDTAVGLSRARAASLLMLALPGGVYLYQGEELGLPDHTAMQGLHRQDPSFLRTGGERLGRDGCRVPLPWTSGGDSYGFSTAGESWLPQPDHWTELARENQSADPESTLTLYREALGLRKELGLGSGSLGFSPEYDGDVVAFVNGSILVAMNMGLDAAGIPDGDILAASEPGAGEGNVLQPNQTVWIQLG
ncbi:glycoside hydrolase family 13 protein [Arthrobacter monumenti]